MGKGQLGGAPSWFKKITDKIRRDISNTQGQNVITYPYYESSKTENGVQFSIRSDGTIKVNGHATADTYFKLHSHLKSDGNLTVPFGIYTLSGCPKGGSSSIYFMQVTMSIAGSEHDIITDYGNGGIGDIDNEGDYITSTDAYIGIKICIKSGTTVSDLIFKPMLEKGTASHEYQPTNLTNKTFKNILSGFSNVGNFKAVSTEADQELSDTEKSNARANIGLDNVENTIADAKKAGTDAQTAINNHTGNKSNPHAVTKAQVGLGNVPNVATNDQTPTFTAATSRANIVSGEKLSVILGKIMKFFTDLKSVAFSGSYTDLSNIPSTFTPASHTHNYAGSASAGGSANSAAKLDTTTAGSATQPVYFKDGKPVACTYSVAKSVPSNAVFTDTTYNGSNLKTSATKTASNTSSITNSIASGTALDAAIQTLLNNDKTLDTKSDEVDNKSISTYDANVYYRYGNVVYYEGKVYRHIKVTSGGTPGVKGEVPTNTTYWKEIAISDLFKELSNAASILSTLTSNDFNYSGGPTQTGALPYTVNESLEAIANVLSSLNRNLSNGILFFDYSNQTKITDGSTSFTAPSNGLLTGAFNTNDGYDGNVFVNGNNILRIRDRTGATGTNCTPFSIILSKGDIVTTRDSLIFSDQAYFYPCKSLG